MRGGSEIAELGWTVGFDVLSCRQGIEPLTGPWSLLCAIKRLGNSVLDLGRVVYFSSWPFRLRQLRGKGAKDLRRRVSSWKDSFEIVVTVSEGTMDREV